MDIIGKNSCYVEAFEELCYVQVQPVMNHDSKSTPDIDDLIL